MPHVYLQMNAIQMQAQFVNQKNACINNVYFYFYFFSMRMYLMRTILILRNGLHTDGPNFTETECYFRDIQFAYTKTQKSVDVFSMVFLRKNDRFSVTHFRSKIFYSLHCKNKVLKWNYSPKKFLYFFVFIIEKLQQLCIKLFFIFNLSLSIQKI